MSVWDENKIKILREYWGILTASALASKIGGVSRNAVIGKAFRLNLSAKIKTKTSATFNKNVDTEKNYIIRKRGRKNKFLLNKEILNNLGPAKLLTLEELTEKTCKYMMHKDQDKEGHPDDPNSFFCGRDTIDKYSYCVYHMGIVWQTRDKKDELLDKDEDVPKFIEKKIKSA
mgnify:CR=1 FL=1